MDVIKKFIKVLCNINLIHDPHHTVDVIYDEVETLDVDLHVKEVKNNVSLPYDMRIKIIDLVELYYLNIDECVNRYSDKKCYEFLKDIKRRAEEVSSYLA